MTQPEAPQPGFWFASVGGAPTEIVRIHDGLMYSTGCADGHSLAGVELIELIVDDDFPLPKAEREAAAAKFERARLKHHQTTGAWQNYRRFP